mgnify:FL=1
MNKPQVNVDLKQTTPVTSSSGNPVFRDGIILRRVSKFLIASEKDGIVPVACFYDPKSGEILTEMLPKELREEYETYNKSLGKLVGIPSEMHG